MKADWWLVILGHVKALQDGSAESRLCSAGQELIQLNQQAIVRVLGLYNLHGRLVSNKATSCFQIDTHSVLLNENKEETITKGRNVLITENGWLIYFD